MKIFPSPLVNFCLRIATMCVQSSLSLSPSFSPSLSLSFSLSFSLSPSLSLPHTHKSSHRHTHAHHNRLRWTHTPPLFTAHSSCWLELSGVRGSQWRMSIGLIHRHREAHACTHSRMRTHTHTHTHAKAIKEASRQNDRQTVMWSYLKCV